MAWILPNTAVDDILGSVKMLCRAVLRWAGGIKELKRVSDFFCQVHSNSVTKILLKYKEYSRDTSERKW